MSDRVKFDKSTGNPATKNLGRVSENKLCKKYASYLNSYTLEYWIAKIDMIDIDGAIHLNDEYLVILQNSECFSLEIPITRVELTVE